jgi:hypothetical protein
MKNFFVIMFVLVSLFTISCSFNEQRWDLEVTGKVPSAAEECLLVGINTSCGKVWWLDTAKEKHYKTWAIISECYKKSRIGYDLPDECR